MRLVREQASISTKRANARMRSRQQRSLKIPIYHVGDKVLVRLASKISRVTNRLTVLSGRITDRRLKRYRYKVAFKHPYTRGKKEQWFRLSDITADTLSNQNKCERVTVPRRQHIKNYYITVTQKKKKIELNSYPKTLDCLYVLIRREMVTANSVPYVIN